MFIFIIENKITIDCKYGGREKKGLISKIIDNKSELRNQAS